VRFLLHGINYSPESVGIGPFNSGLAEALAARGHNVTVVCAIPYYPHWQTDPAHRSRLWSEEERNGVRVIRTWLHVPRRVRTLTRIVHELSFAIVSSPFLWETPRPDLLITVSPPLPLGVTACLFSGLSGTPFLFYVKDLQPDAAVDLGMLGRSGPARLAAKLLFAVERTIYRRAALVGTLTEGMRRRIVDKGIPEEHVALLPDWVDQDRYRPLPRQNAFRERHGLGNRFLALHAGNMGVKQGLETMLLAAERLVDLQGAEFYLVGDGAARPELIREAERMELPNLRILPLQPAGEVPEMMAAADVGLLIQKASVSDIVMPSKLLAMLASGLPVIATVRDDTEVALAIRESGAGIVIPPEDPEVLAGAIRSLHDDPSLRQAMSERAASYALGRWGRDRVLAELVERLETLARL
jgi:colanic acid biosynthesis glycosyl transferase WcaI